MREYEIEYRDGRSGQAIVAFFTGDQTLADYLDKCRRLVGEGHHDVRLYEVVREKRIVREFDETQIGEE